MKIRLLILSLFITAALFGQTGKKYIPWLEADDSVINDSIKSTKFSPGSQGWYIDSRANSEFRNVKIRNHAGTPDFFSGFTGSGWRIANNDGSADAEFDNLTVRKSMKVYELLIQKIRSVNGGLVISSANATADSVYFNSPTGVYQIFPEDDDISFVAGDLVRVQTWTGKGIKYYCGVVGSVDYSLSCFYMSNSLFEGADRPEPGDEMVQFGNLADPNRQGLLYLTAHDSYSPYLDVLDGVNSTNLSGKTKVRLGKLDGISTSTWGDLTGYGLYGSNVYLEGSLATEDGELVSSRFAVMADKISSKVSKTTFDTLYSDVNYLIANVDSLAGIDLSYVNDSLQALRTSVTIAESGITQLADEITLKVSKDTYESGINGLKSQVSSAYSLISQNAAGILLKASQTDLDGLEDRVSSAELKITPSAIISTVSGTVNTAQQAAQAYADAMVNGIEIGGTNLLPGSESLELSAESTNNYANAVLKKDLKQKKTYTFSCISELISGSAGSFTVRLYDLNTNIPALPKIFPFLSQRQSYTFTTPETGSYALIIYAGQPGSTAGNSVKYTYLKLEEGNKATAWSPAPEDMATASGLGNVESRVTTAESSITQLANSIKLKVNQNEYETGMSGMASRLSSAEASIQMNVDNITSKVSSATYESGLSETLSSAQSYVDDAVEGIKIGGTNLIQQSETLSKNFIQYGGSGVSTSKTLKAGTDPNGGNNAIRLQGGGRFSKCVLNNGTYTFSVWVKKYPDGSTTAVSTDICDVGNTSINISNGEWHYITNTVTVTNYTSGTYHFADIGYNSNIDVLIYHPKLESGNVATAWSPAPEDMATATDLTSLTTRVSTAESSIAQNAGNIELKVSKDGVINSINLSKEGLKIDANVVATGDITTLGNVTAGAFNLGNGKFVVDSNGNLTASNASIDGKITATSGTIGGFSIGSYSLTATSGYSNMLLSPSLIRFTHSGEGSTMFMGTNVFPATMGGSMAGPMRVEVDRSITYEAAGNIGTYYNVTGSTSYDDNGLQYTGNHAIYAANGDYAGLRMRTRRVTSSQTLSNMDNVILTIPSSAITLTLPASPEEGQIYFIRRCTNVNITISVGNTGSHKITYKDASSAGTSQTWGDWAMMILIWDKTNSIWWASLTRAM